MSHAFEHALVRARKDLDELRSRAGARTGPSRPDRTASASTCDGRVVAHVRGGRLVGVDIDRRLLALTPEELGGHVAGAVDSALIVARSSRPDEHLTQRPDVAAMAGMLATAQGEILVAVGAISSSIQDAIARVGARSGMRGDSGDQGLERLLHRTLTALRLAADRAEDRGCAEGTDAAGHVAVRLATTRRVRAVRIAPSAMRESASALGGYVVDAVNAALDDAGPRDTCDAEAHARATTELNRTVREIQDQSLEHMRTYTRSLAAIMATIQDP